VSENLKYTLIDGIKCFSPEVLNSYADYPDNGFDLTNENAEGSFWVSSRNRLFKSLVLRNALPRGKTRYLDIGCGTGDFISQLNSSENLEITGSEIYLKGLQYAKKNLPGVDFIQFDVTQGVLEEKFDMITAFDVVEHIDNDMAAISNIFQMLNKGGVFVVSAPQHMFMWSRLDEIVKHKRRYSRQELISKLTNNGFEIVYTTSFLFVLFPLMWISRMFDKGRTKSCASEVELDKRVKFSRSLNFVFDLFMRVDEMLIRLGISLPVGGTIVVVARKPG